MSRLLQRGAEWLRDKLPEAAAVVVEIRAYNVAIETIDAVPGRHNFQQYIVEDAAGTADEFDWVVEEQELVFPGEGKKQPETGWEIHYRMEDGRVAVFVVRPAAGSRAFDVLDQFGLLYRVHTKLDRIESHE